MFIGSRITQQQERNVNNARKRWLKYAYGISPEQMEAIKLAQRGMCPVCQLPLENDNPKNQPVPDHIKGTKTIRGILHNHCNLVLGHAHEDPMLLRRAAEYLEKWI